MAVKAGINSTSQTPLAVVDQELLTVTRPELLTNRSDSDFRTLIHRLISLSRRIVTIRDGFGTLAGLSGVQYEILMLVSRLEGQTGVTVTDISASMRQSGAFTTIEIGKLADKGLIEKSADLADRRRVRLRLTEEGRKMLARLVPHQRQVNDAVFGNLDKGQLEELGGLLRDLLPAADHGAHLMEFILKRENDFGLRNGV